MEVCPYGKVSNYPCWEDAQNLIFCITFEIRFGQTWHGVNHKDPIYHISTSSYHPYTTKGGYGPLKQQCMSLLAEQYPISPAERAPEIWHFTWNLRVLLGRNDTVLTIRGLCMQAETPILICVHLRNDMKYSSSNGCLSLQHSIPYPVLRGCPKSDILHENWD